MWELTLSWSINCISTRSGRAYFSQIWMLKMKNLWVVIDGELSKTWLLKGVKAFVIYTNRNTKGIDASGQDESTKPRFIFPPQITKNTEQNTWNKFFFSRHWTASSTGKWSLRNRWSLQLLGVLPGESFQATVQGGGTQAKTGNLPKLRRQSWAFKDVKIT